MMISIADYLKIKLFLLNKLNKSYFLNNFLIYLFIYGLFSFQKI